MDGEDTYSSKLALFQKPYIESSMDKFLPTSTISDGSVIEFRIPGTSSEYVDLQRCRLKVKLQIVDNQGTPIVAEDKVGLVNLSLSSIFRQVDVQMQEKLVSSEINICYPYICHYRCAAQVWIRCERRIITEQALLQRHRNDGCRASW